MTGLYGQYQTWGMDSDPAERWEERAACRPGTGVDPELFFVEGKSASAHEALQQALTFCGRCPVRSQCRQFGATEPFGIWGGTTPLQRRAGSRWHNTEQRTCLRCEQPFEVGPGMTYARICWPCREDHPDSAIRRPRPVAVAS